MIFCLHKVGNYETTKLQNYKNAKALFCKKFEDIDELYKLIEEQNKQILELQDALNETRQQVQALLDYCFTDRSKWKEGQVLLKSDTSE